MAKEIRADFILLKKMAQLGRLLVINFAAGGVATLADAALMMQLGCNSVFMGSSIFKSSNTAKRAKAIVQAVTDFNNPGILMEINMDLGEAIVGINISTIKEKKRLAKRG